MPESYLGKFNMYKFHPWLVSSVAVLALASCSTPQSSTPSAPAPASPAMAPDKAMTPTTQPGVSGFTALQNVVNKTQAAVEAGNFEQAKAEFGKFEDSWKTVEDGVKSKSSATYSAIEDGMDDVNGGIKDKNKAQVLSALQTLTKSIVSVAKP
jgi:hypothetical protein